jgi:hypothetical protein
MKHINYCHKKDCLKFQEINWNGEYMDKWYCDLCLKKENTLKGGIEDNETKN